MLIAKCISDKDWFGKEGNLVVGNSYDVDYVSMGESYTSIYLTKYKNEPFNSVSFEFYECNKKINIYKDSMYNPYLG